MKRTAATIALVAGVGGCVSPDKAPGEPFGQARMGKEVPGVVGPTGEPVMAKARGQGPAAKADPGIAQVGFRKVGGSAGCGDGSCGDAPSPHVVTPGFGHGHMHAGGHGLGHGHLVGGGLGHRPGHGHGLGHGPGGGFGPEAYGPTVSPFQQGVGHGGILPAPAFGPHGAVAAVGAMGPGAFGGPYGGQRTSVRFANPPGMRVTWQTAGGGFPEAALEAPARYNFPQGSVYRLKLTNVPGRPGTVYYPTLEVYPATIRTVTYLSHNAVPVGLTDEDFDQVRAGNLVVKVVYLPHDAYQDLAALGGLDEVVSTRLEPGVDPIVEANRRGTILAVVRLGNIDLQDPNTPAVDAPGGMAPPVGGVPAPAVMAPAPGMVPPGSPVPGVTFPGMMSPGAMPTPPAVPNGSAPILPPAPAAPDAAPGQVRRPAIKGKTAVAPAGFRSSAK